MSIRPMGLSPAGAAGTYVPNTAPLQRIYFGVDAVTGQPYYDDSTPPLADQAEYSIVDGNIVLITNDETTHYLALGDQVPTLEELQRSVALPASISATTSPALALGATNMDERIGGATFQFTTAIAANDVDYYTIALQVWRAGVLRGTIVSQTTKVAGGKAIPAFSGWSMDNANWDAALRLCNKDDGLAVLITKTGSPAALTGGVVMIRTEPGVTA